VNTFAPERYRLQPPPKSLSLAPPPSPLPRRVCSIPPTPWKVVGRTTPSSFVFPPGSSQSQSQRKKTVLLRNLLFLIAFSATRPNGARESGSAVLSVRREGSEQESVLASRTRVTDVAYKCLTAPIIITMSSSLLVGVVLLLLV